MRLLFVPTHHIFQNDNNRMLSTPNEFKIKTNDRRQSICNSTPIFTHFPYSLN